MIEKGADINQADTGEYDDRLTPLSFACQGGHTEIALALIEKGADINQAATGENNAGRTPLSFACGGGHTETALALIEKGADINQVATGGLYAGRTPLSFACERGHTEIALALIEKGADINQAATGEENAGRTPLSFACENGHTEIALALIEKGADTSKIKKNKLKQLLSSKNNAATLQEQTAHRTADDSSVQISNVANQETISETTRHGTFRAINPNRIAPLAEEQTENQVEAVGNTGSEMVISQTNQSVVSIRQESPSSSPARVMISRGDDCCRCVLM